MKITFKIVLLILLTTGYASSSFAGDNGVRAGYGLSWWSGDNLKLKNFTHSPYVGYVRHFRLAPTLMLGTGLDYHMTGYRIDDSHAINQHNLSVPAYLRLGLGPIVLYAGAHGSITPVTTVPDYFDSKDYRPYDFGFLGGIEFQIAIVSFGPRVYINQLGRVKDADEDTFSRIVQLGATIAF